MAAILEVSSCGTKVLKKWFWDGATQMRWCKIPRRELHPKLSLKERLWSHLIPDGECLIWSGARDKDGYGRVRDGNKVHTAHRLAYAFVVGATLDRSIMLSHTCGNRACCNVEHLKRKGIDE
jgi:hypothetical protein